MQAATSIHSVLPMPFIIDNLSINDQYQCIVIVVRSPMKGSHDETHLLLHHDKSLIKSQGHQEN